MSPRLAGRRLYIADLARRRASLEDGHVPMYPLGYRVLAKRLLSALADEAATGLRQGFPELPPTLLPVLAEAPEARHFDEHGLQSGPQAAQVRAQADTLLRQRVAR